MTRTRQGSQTKHGSAKQNFWEVFRPNCSTLPHRYLWINLCYRGTQLGISATGRLLWYTVLKWRLIMRSQITGTAERCRKSDNKSEYLPLPDVFRDNERPDACCLIWRTRLIQADWLTASLAEVGEKFQLVRTTYPVMSTSLTTVCIRLLQRLLCLRSAVTSFGSKHVYIGLLTLQ